jgi:hypothetical protein
MAIIIKTPNLEILTSKGIPKCFADIRNYFNKALKTNSLPWIPRKTPITNDEIKNLWVPSIKNNITFHAELNKRVVGSITVFYKKDSTAYENASEREIGDIGYTSDPEEDYEPIAKSLFETLILELKKSNRKARLTTAIESPGNKVLSELGYKGKLIENQERYIHANLSGKVMEYFFP